VSEELRKQIFNLAMKIKYQGRAMEARVAAIEQRLGIPTPPKPTRLPGESPAPKCDNSGHGGSE
jgi:hypothetical protein